MRRKKSKIKKAWANCRACSWMNTTSGAMGAAAMHHDETGHTVECEQTLQVVYGNPRVYGSVSGGRSAARR